MSTMSADAFVPCAQHLQTHHSEAAVLGCGSCMVKCQECSEARALVFFDLLPGGICQRQARCSSCEMSAAGMDLAGMDTSFLETMADYGGMQSPQACQSLQPQSLTAMLLGTPPPSPPVQQAPIQQAAEVCSTAWPVRVADPRFAAVGIRSLFVPCPMMLRVAAGSARKRRGRRLS